MPARPHVALINLNSAHWLGGHNYFQHIIRAIALLPAHERAFDLTYIVAAPLAPELEAELSATCRILVAPEVRTPDSGFAARGRRYLRRRVRGLNDPELHDVLVREGVTFAYPCATGGEKSGGYRTAHWIADLQFKHFPQFQLPEALASGQAYLEDIVANASTIVVSSSFGEQDCHRHYPETIGRTFSLPFRVMPSVAPYGHTEINAPARYNLPARFLILSNQFWQNKNHLVVFEALALLKARGVDANLVCTGHVYDPRLPAYSDTVLSRLHELGVADRVQLLGAIPRRHQLDLLRRSVAVLQPSLFEGWNTSIEEARFFGRRAIVSSIPVHREQVWDGMRSFEPGDAEALAEAIAGAWPGGGDGTIDLPRETAARDAYLDLVRSFAQRFLELAL